jgi:hypothetical protein
MTYKENREGQASLGVLAGIAAAGALIVYSVLGLAGEDVYRNLNSGQKHAVVERVEEGNLAKLADFFNLNER